MINEIVLAEETDLNLNGHPTSHFEMYLEAMEEVGADTTRFHGFLYAVTDILSVQRALATSQLNRAEHQFLSFTFQTIASAEMHRVASAFTFGRESIIPEMFLQVIAGANGQGLELYPKLTYYLQRHIEVDGDEHGPMAMEMITELCGTDQNLWNDVLEVAISALQNRLALWDDVTHRLVANACSTN